MASIAADECISMSLVRVLFMAIASLHAHRLHHRIVGNAACAFLQGTFIVATRTDLVQPMFGIAWTPCLASFRYTRLVLGLLS